MGCKASKPGSAAVASAPAAAEPAAAEPVALLTQRDSGAKVAEVLVTPAAEVPVTPAAAPEPLTESRSSAVVELVVGEKAKLKKQGTMGRVLQTTTTDVQVEMEDGTVAWHEIEDLAQVTPELKVGALAKLKKKEGTMCTVLALTTTDVQVELEDGTTEWHEIEDLLAQSESVDAGAEPDTLPPLQAENTTTETVVAAVPDDTMVLEEVPVKGITLCCI